MIRLAALCLSCCRRLAGSRPGNAAWNCCSRRTPASFRATCCRTPTAARSPARIFAAASSLIAFGYTYCPDICPTTLVEMAAILKQLGDQAGAPSADFHHGRSRARHRQGAEDLHRIFRPTHPRPDRLHRRWFAAPPTISRFAMPRCANRAKTANYAVDHSAGMILLGPGWPVHQEICLCHTKHGPHWQLHASHWAAS
jgi:protein SCO1/2